MEEKQIEKVQQVDINPLVEIKEILVEIRDLLRDNQPKVLTPLELKVSEKIFVPKKKGKKLNPKKK